MVAGRSEDTYRLEARKIFKGLRHLRLTWAEPLRFGRDAELGLEVACKVCHGTVKLVGRALVASGSGSKTTESLTIGAKKDLAAHRLRHEACPVKGRKTKGVQQDLGI